MSKMRVYTLAKELNISSKDLISKLLDLGVHVKNHMSTLEDEEVDMIVELVKETKSDEATKKKETISLEARDDSEDKDDFDKYEAEFNEEDRFKQRKSVKKKKNKKAAMESTAVQQQQNAPVDKIEFAEGMTVREFAELIKKNPSEVVRDLLFMKYMLKINDVLPYEVVQKLADKYGITVEKKEADSGEVLDEEKDDPQSLKPRPPIVTVMGHVDHGKTSLLDAIRNTNVTAREVGGITQHIGASTVELNGKKIVFLDTPGHEAFTSMRSRGAQVTDIAVLVVAADDGVMPQTVEAINHAKAAKVPIIVAINKIDKAEANPDRVKQELTEYGLIPEEWGGDTICIPVSATKKQGINDLLEMILLVAEMQELKANPDKQARGTVIEALLDKGRGPVATVIVQSGTLRVGDAIVVGTAYGKVRALFDDKGRKLKQAGPSTPVEVLGLSEVPEAGDLLVVVEDEKKARELAEARKEKMKETRSAAQKVTLEDLFDQMQQGNIKELNVIVKADVQGSVEALKQAILKLSSDELRVNILHEGVGVITETDVMLASASNAIIIGFNVRPDSKARDLAEREKVDIRLYRIIYDVIDDIEKALKGLLEPEYREVYLGRAEVRQLFKVSGLGTIAGCYVLDGKITRTASVRLVRDGAVVYEGKIISLKRFKDDVREVAAGYECGLMLEKFNDIKESDIIEAFTTEEVQR
ncbi:translation initiation factor IF-2 [Caldanaerobius polysaccharolyticus]|uniref:translation initiation factor IF-2 n=1 Tax=Caldanaerobius polysaccharolyticus TaxID=44256 RepID=UPI00047B62D0|nr:translation initiation factor IF-2 [Caldanaerobius polysaccharolyticus]